MADEISGQVTEGGTPVEDAIVIAALQEEAANLSQAQATELQSLAKLTDANGEYVFETEELFSGSENYHVVAHKDAGDQRRGQQNYPYVEAENPIPDSVVSRDTDDDSFGDSNARGLKFTTTESWPSIQGEISSNTVNASIAYVTETDGTVIDSVSISTLTPGDVFTFNNINLSSGSYYMLLNNDGSEYTVGNTNQVSYPYTDSDGDLSIDTGVFNGLTSPSEYGQSTYSIVQLGNINL